MTQVLQICDLKKVAGAPRIHDLRLGEALGMPRTRDVRRIIRKNARELQSHGQLHRQGKLDAVLAQLVHEFGEDRVPSRSSLSRWWVEQDKLTAVH